MELGVCFKGFNRFAIVIRGSVLAGCEEEMSQHEAEDIVKEIRLVSDGTFCEVADRHERNR